MSSISVRRRLVLLAVVAVLVVAAILVVRAVRESEGPGYGDRPFATPVAAAGSPGSSAASPGAGSGSASSPASRAPGTPGSTGSPGASADPVLVGAGDIASCSYGTDEQTGRLLAGMDGTVFAAGDLAYDKGTAAQFSQCYEPAWGGLKDRTRPVPGNHDWVSGLDPYLAYWGDRAVNASGDPWYSFDLGTWHVVMLDADCGSVGGCGPDSKEGRWLQADLADSNASCTLAIWHQPRFSSGQHGDYKGVAAFWDALFAAHAELVINGHDHDYERFAPQRSDGTADATNGIREFVVGTGGVPLRGFEHPKPNSEVRLSTSNGVLRLVLHPRGYDWAFIGVDGTTQDQGSGACH